MTQTVRISGWVREIPDCWKIEFNNFPDKVLQVEDIKYFNTLYKAISNTGYTMTVDWLPPRSENGRFILHIVDNKKGFSVREFSANFIRPGALMSLIKVFSWGLCSKNHKKLWHDGGYITIPYDEGQHNFNSSKPSYYHFKNRYVRFEGKEGIVYDEVSGKELFRKNLNNANLEGLVLNPVTLDPFNRGFLVFFEPIPEEYAPITSYMNTGEQQDGFDFSPLHNPKFKDFPKDYSNLGLFDENLNVIWWAESLRKINSYYFTLTKFREDFMEFSAYGRGVKLNPKTGKILEQWFEK
jgi:hypothetical protein